MITFMDTRDRTGFLMISESCMRTGLCYFYSFLSVKCQIQNTALSLSEAIMISNASVRENRTWTAGPIVVTTSGDAGRKRVV